jgi:hypothetical protein
MNTNKKITAVKDRKVILSTLWIFVMFNYLYCDVMTLMDPVFLKQFMAGSVAGFQITEGFLLAAAVLMEIPIVMVLLARVLNYGANRWANIIAATIKTVVMILTMFGTPPPTLYYMFFGTIEIGCTLFIVWYAWTWRNPEGTQII